MIDIISEIEDTTKSISATYMANNLREKLLNLLKKKRPKTNRTLKKNHVVILANSLKIIG